MHHIYHTHGFILGSVGHGEANKTLVIYTRELGLVRARAQGIRLAKSKLRFGLQDFSYAKIDLVRGKDVWRVTSGSTVDSFPFARANRNTLLLIAQISKLIERLCNGEEANSRIFDEIIQAFYLLDNPDIKKETCESIEMYLVLRIVHNLGYVGDSDLLVKYLGDEFNKDQLDSILTEKGNILGHINKALRESQL